MALGAGTTAAHFTVARQAVAVLNDALPASHQLRIAASRAPAGPASPGRIHLWFLSFNEWPDYAKGSHGFTPWYGVAWRYWDATETIYAAEIYLDPNRAPRGDVLTVAVHELLHTLGRVHPSPAFRFSTLMVPDAAGYPGGVLYPVDREALRAEYR